MAAYGGVSAAHAQGVGLTRIFDDPLGARPPVLDTGATLPGENGLLVCADNVSADRPIGLSDAIDIALCASPKVKTSWAAIKIQAGAVGEARAAYLPTLTSTLSQLHSRNEFPGRPQASYSSDGHTVYAGLSWRIFDFGTREANRESANALLVAAISAHDAALQKLLGDVVDTYVDALSARAIVVARTESSRLAQGTLEATERRQRRGVAGQIDTLQAKTAFAKAQLAEQRARADYSKALSMLAYTMGLSGKQTLELAEMPAADAADPVGELAGWLNEAASKHPAIAAARARWNAAQSKIRQVKSEGRPTIDLTSNIYQNGYPNQGLQATRSTVTTVGVQLTIPIFEGFARTYKVRGAEAQAEQSAAELEDTEHQILSEVVKTHADAVAALSNLNASEELLKSARAAMASSERRYGTGVADILELLSTQSALADALQERVRVVSEWRSARLRLMAAVGQLGRN